MDEVVLSEKAVSGAFRDNDPADYWLPELNNWLEGQGQSKNVSLREPIEVEWMVTTEKWRTRYQKNTSYTVTTPDSGWSTKLLIPLQVNLDSKRLILHI